MRHALLVAASLVAASAIVNSQLPAPRTGGSDGPPLRTANSELVTRDAYLMGTRAHLATYASARDNGLATLETALRVLESTERELSTWRADSEISALNRQPIGHAWSAPASICRLLQAVFSWHADTEGAFDPGIGRVIDAWDVHGAGRVPSPEQLTAAHARSGLSKLSLHTPRCEVTRRADATIDVGAFGKGEALDRVEAALGAGAWLVDLGGQVSVGGPQPDGRSWTVDIADPGVRDAAYTQATLQAGSLSTSGSSERDVNIHGTRVGHILDPRTARPAAFRGSVTVWHRSGLAADALSTALYVMGPEQGVRWADRRGIAAMFLVPDGDRVRTVATSAWSFGS